MAKKRIKNKNHIEAKSENKVLHGLAGSIEEALSEDPSEIEPVSYTHLTLPTICSV